MHESSKFWLNVLIDLKSWGILDVYLFSTDGLCGMMETIWAFYPKSSLQRCIVHQIRSSTWYVSYKDIKKVIADLKKIYTAVILDEAEENLHYFADAWLRQYPSCVRSWEDNCAPTLELTGRKSSRKMERKGAKTTEEKTKKKGTPPPRYDEAFKAGAIRMVTEQGLEPKEVARIWAFALTPFAIG